MSNRLFLLDPVCILPFGHNAPLLKHYAAFAQHAFTEVHVICNRHFPSTSSTTNFRRHFQHYYNFVLPVPHSEPVMPGLTDSDPFNDCCIVDPYEQASALDMWQLWSELDIGSGDTIFFPSADYYGALAAIRTVGKLPPASRPRLLLRFIGVMETASPYTSAGLTHLASILREVHANGARISLSAETPKYAEFLMRAFHLPVDVVPYPMMYEPRALPSSDEHYIFCAGSSRHDKGLLHLHRIIQSVRQSDTQCRFQFVLQLPSAAETRTHIGYLRQLYALPGVHLLPAAISETLMVSWYSKSSLCLLPYDPDTYKLRGSAVLMEATAIGRPVVSLAGPAFADQIAFFNLGIVAPTLSHIPSLINDYLEQPLHVRQMLVTAARARYATAADNANREWLL